MKLRRIMKAQNLKRRKKKEIIIIIIIIKKKEEDLDQVKGHVAKIPIKGYAARRAARP